MSTALESLFRLLAKHLDALAKDLTAEAARWAKDDPDRDAHEAPAEWVTIKAEAQRRGFLDARALKSWCRRHEVIVRQDGRIGWVRPDSIDAAIRKIGGTATPEQEEQPPAVEERVAHATVSSPPAPRAKTWKERLPGETWPAPGGGTYRKVPLQEYLDALPANLDVDVKTRVILLARKLYERRPHTTTHYLVELKNYPKLQAVIFAQLERAASTRGLPAVEPIVAKLPKMIKEPDREELLALACQMPLEVALHYIENLERHPGQLKTIRQMLKDEAGMSLKDRAELHEWVGMDSYD